MFGRIIIGIVKVIVSIIVSLVVAIIFLLIEMTFVYGKSDSFLDLREHPGKTILVRDWLVWIGMLILSLAMFVVFLIYMLKRMFSYRNKGFYMPVQPTPPHGGTRKNWDDYDDARRKWDDIYGE